MRAVFLSLFIIFIFSTSTFAGGPWTSTKKHGYFQLGYNTIGKTNDFFFDGNKSILFNRPISDNTMAAYFEYGVSEKIDIIAKIPYVMVSSGSLIENATILPVLPGGELNGLGNIDIAGKYQFYKKNKFLVAGELNFSIPTSKEDISTGLRTGYQSLGIQPSIYGGLSKGKFYTYMKLGYNIKTELRDELKLSTEFGYKILKEIYLILDFDLLLATGKPLQTLVPVIEQTGLYADGQEYSAMTIKVSSKVYKNFGINLHSTLANFHGNYVQKAASIGGSIFYKF